MCRDAIGAEFTGYKGGEYYMDGQTPLWVSEHGVSSGVALVGVELVNGTLELRTKQVDA